jgi:cytochrome c peroxidase
LTTLARRVDPKQLIDVVKEEVKGGEVTSGPTPLNYFWLPSDRTAIRDQPYTITEPLGLDPVAGATPASNPITKGKVELGRQLYFDPRVSRNGTVSCATCHDPAKGWTDHLKSSIGIGGQVGSRNAPTVLNTVYRRALFWDGRAPSLELQAQGPIQNKIEMGDQSYGEIIERLRAVPGYREQFKKVFGTDVTLDGMVKAIASFERTALSGDSPYDRYTRGTPEAETFETLKQSEKRGMVLFGLRLQEDDPFTVDPKLLKKANCTSCHDGFNFTDEKFHNLGVGFDATRGKFADLGRFAIAPVGAKNETEVGSFRTPTLRDIARTGPYMHDGSEPTLESVVEYYNKGGNPNDALDPEIKPLNLTDQDKADLVAFMKALTGKEIRVASPKLPPGPDGKSPDPGDALAIPTVENSVMLINSSDVHNNGPTRNREIRARSDKPR